MTPQDWDRLGWPARVRYISRLNRREQLAADGLACCPSCWAERDNRANDGEWTREVARALLAAMPQEPDDITAERRDYLNTLTTNKKGKR
jgi:hypothetical protein